MSLHSKPTTYQSRRTWSQQHTSPWVNAKGSCVCSAVKIYANGTSVFWEFPEPLCRQTGRHFRAERWHEDRPHARKLFPLEAQKRCQACDLSLWPLPDLCSLHSSFLI